jgi:hypothetical protein
MSYRRTALAVLVLFASVAAACGSDGSGCTCTQCGEEGYTYYCPNNNECYSSLDTCNDDPFGSCSGTCVATKSCHAPLACSPAQQASCGSGTCCINADTFQTFCAPANATCCNWHDNYCPNEAACDPPTGTCLPPQPAQNQTLGCSLCVQAVTYVQNSAEGDVCSAICTFVSTTEPALSAICGKLMNWTGLCGWLEAQIANDVSPQDVCNMVGLCSQAPGTCSCGYCTPAWYGQWCLATPNVCPANASATRQRTVENPHYAKRHVSEWNFVPAITAMDAFAAQQNDVTVPSLGTLREMRLPIHIESPAMAVLKNKLRATEYCVDSMCDDQYQGCCLTCL